MTWTQSVFNKILVLVCVVAMIWAGRTGYQVHVATALLEAEPKPKDEFSTHKSDSEIGSKMSPQKEKPQVKPPQNEPIQKKEKKEEANIFKGNGIAKQIIFTHPDRFRPINTFKSWGDQNPNYKLMHFNNAKLEDLVKTHRPSLYKLFPKLNWVEKADVFRYVATYVHGGVYTDIDVSLNSSIDEWPRVFNHKTPLSKLDFIFGLEMTHPIKFPRGSKFRPLSLQFVQWSFAGAKGSPLMAHVLDHLESTIVTVPKTDDDSTLDRTGPRMFTTAILQFIAKYGNPKGVDSNNHDHPLSLHKPYDMERQDGQLIRLTNAEDGDSVPKFDITGLIVPYRAMGFHVTHEEYLMKQQQLLKHSFAGSWRKEPSLTLLVHGEKKGKRQRH